MDGKVSFIIIKTKNQGIFISDKTGTQGYYSSKIPNLLFDGLKLQATPKEHWYKLSEIPKKVERQSSDKTTLRHWKLKKGFPESELTPATILPVDWDEDDDIAGLYSPVYDVVKGELEEVEFEIEVLSEEENFYIEKPKYPSTPNLIVALTTDKALHSERPCSLTSAEFYKIVREHIKRNIDGRYARITSDYDFCFTVKKVIKLATPSSYKTDIGTKRRPNIVTRYNPSKEVTVFEAAPSPREGYTVLAGISGKNQKDLEDKVDKYLEEAIRIINKPLEECSHCDGTGCVNIEKK